MIKILLTGAIAALTLSRPALGEDDRSFDTACQLYDKAGWESWK